jgi:hypothetical protein
MSTYVAAQVQPLRQDESIEELLGVGRHPVGGSLSKEVRIRRLMPLFEQAKIVLLPYWLRNIYDWTTADLVQDIIKQEYTAFPVSQHDDMLDALSRMCDEKELGLHWPQTDLQRAQRQTNLPPSYLPTGSNGTPMSRVERH